MRKITTALITILGALFCGCLAPRNDQGSERVAVMMAVLADMVTNADTKGELVCFVDLQPSEIDRLSDITGHRFPIAPADESEITDQGVRSKGSRKEGVLIKVEVGKIHNGKAEMFGSYDHCTKIGFAGFRYRLRCTRGAWHVISAECTVAS